MTGTWFDVIQAHLNSDSYCAADASPPGQAPAKRPWWAASLKYGVQLFLCGYLGTVMIRSNTYQQSVASSSSSPSNVLYESPEGLKMSLHSEFPNWFLNVHKWAGIALIPLCVAQKHLVPHMGPIQHKAQRRWIPVETARKLHVFLGYSAIGAMGYMATCGFLLRSSSTFTGFHWAMVLFVAPWFAFLTLIPLSVWKEWRLVHALVGASVFKACVAVPLARTLGVVFQSLGTSETIARDYYLGIATSAVIVGCWAIRDTIAMVSALRALSKERTTVSKKE